MRPSPLPLSLHRAYRALRMGADDAPPAADRHAAGYSPAALLKSVLLVLPAAENPPFRRKAGVRRGFAAFCTCGSLCSFPRGVPPAPRRKPHPSCGLREQRPHPRSTAARRTGVGALPQRGLPAPATPERSAARVPAKRKRRTLYGSARLWIYGAGTRALTS